MDVLLDEASVVLVALTIAALALIIEIALPTIGIAGTIALLAGALAIVGISRQDAEWWPLLGPALAIVLWAAMIARQRRSTAGEITAAVAFALGGIGFAIANEDVASLVVTAVATPLLSFGFPRVHGAAQRLAQRPAQVGMEAFVGRIAVVDRWDGASGVVLLDGSRWTAVATAPLTLAAGDHVTVVGTHGSTLAIAINAPAAWPAPPTASNPQS